MYSTSTLYPVSLKLLRREWEYLDKSSLQNWALGKRRQSYSTTIEPAPRSIVFGCMKGQSHDIFDFMFFSWICFPQAPEHPVRTVSNFDFSKIRGDFRGPRPLANLPPVSLIPAVHLHLRIFPRVIEKIRNDPTVIFRSLWEDNSWKKPEAKNLVTLSL